MVHIIHKGEEIGEGSNISDEQIQSAITALNEDFRKEPGSNGDGDGADIGIEFCLARRDPDSNSTNGINRVNGTSVPLYETEGISVGQGSGADEEEVKALSFWPREDYLNIWIVSEIENNDGGSGIQGFAYFPTPNFYDGITIMCNAFGTTGDLKPYTNLNRTTTHEAGHYLGLHHTFRNSNDCDESNCESQGDLVCDTPVTIINSNCSNPECNDSQQVENYMDYTGQACKNMFTEGQKVRMRFTLTEGRSSLLTSLGCSSVFDHDAGISNVFEPTGSLCSSSIHPEVTLTNYGGELLESVMINYQIDNGNEQQFEWNGSLDAGQSENVTLPLILGGSGNQTFTAYTSHPNGITDEIQSNDAASSNFLVSSGTTLTLEIELDHYGSENTWIITQNDNILAEGGPFADSSNDIVISENICLPEGCFNFTMFDDYGNGQSFLSGHFEMKNQDGEILFSDEGNWGSSSSHDFCLEEVTGDAPISSFNSNNSEICEEESINFSSTSTNSPTTYFWEFEGGSPSTSSSQNPTVFYANAGSYAVTLTTANDFGSDEHTESGYIQVQTGPDVFLTSSDISCFGANDGTANVTTESDSAVQWSTGQSGTSISGLEAGTYSVTVSSSAGCESSANFEIEEPSELQITLFKSDLSCFGASDGSVTSTVSGGAAPYEYDWSNGSNSPHLADLDQGIYTLDITDINGCEISENVSVIEPSEITSNTQLISPESCKGHDGSAICNAMGGTGNLFYSWSTETSGQTLDNVSFGSYQVTITDAVGCTIEDEIYIPYDCEDILPTTQLEAANCNKGSYDLSDIITCNQVENAEMYKWQFSLVSEDITEEAFTHGTNNSFSLDEVSFITYGSNFEVKIQVQLNGEWGDWGNSCLVVMNETPAPISLVQSDCQLEYITHGTILQAEMNTGADEYEWLISYSDFSESYFSYITQFTITENLLIPNGEEIAIAIRARYGESWSDFGTPCVFIYDAEDSVSEFRLEDLGVKIYPNPNDGQKFSMDFYNLSANGDVLKIKVYDTAGRLIYTFETEKRNSHISETYRFENKLSRGVYLIQVNDSGQDYNGKLIVR